MIKLDSKTKDVLEWIFCILVAFILALLIRYYIGTPTVVKQSSMYPTLKNNQRLILSRWIRTKELTPERGDIITFEAPDTPTYTSADEVNLANPVATYTNRPTSLLGKFSYYVLEIGKNSYIKRVIGLPGDHVQIKDGKVFLNGTELKEDYLPEGLKTNDEKGAYTDVVVPEGYIFVMGDNREHSTDSRRLGCIPIDKIESKVWIRFWPLTLFGKIK